MVTISQTQCVTLRRRSPPRPLDAKPSPLTAQAPKSAGTTLRSALEQQQGHQQQQQQLQHTPRLRIVWFNALGFLALHITAAYGLWIGVAYGRVLSWLWAILVGVVSGLGVTIGAHRLYTHRSFRATWGLRLALVTLHTIAGQNCLYIWVRDHRQHHKYSDTDADPHNATRGFFFSHIGWLMVRKHPDVIRLGKTIDLTDLEQDAFVMFQKKYYKTLYAIFSIMLPVAVPIYAWNEQPWISLMLCYFTRAILTLNITWLVNSWAHLYGTRPYNNRIEPVESDFVSFLSFGEGWHNYHHSFPYDYRAAELGQRYDLSTRIIEWLARRGWVTDLKAASASSVVSLALAHGDGSHPVCQPGAGASKAADADAAPAPQEPAAGKHFVEALPAPGQPPEPGLSIA
ncbi:acyl-CoA Delta-9 desaturase-like [Schistocerca serialis cubense]|uniref:acyl-CoA Delta-9 desaturase-like n=1 Tax=Schistocerca serialis cubense TaxID=2023355 RepID=UPI00214EB091|nr:acyl-CoA Delta-9 desaturase-like [Schistocerca serialis cubense]XP_049960475.1 acyl-CoA Delta-9 desaturase-like [Schistocerca serialis cubense]